MSTSEMDEKALSEKKADKAAGPSDIVFK